MPSQLSSEIIKQETAPAHAKTEKALIGHIKKIRSVEDYFSLLICLYRFYEPLESCFDLQVAPLLSDYAKRRKAGRLLQDIKSLGYKVPTQRWENLPIVQQPEQALACFYVMEGSILGGAVIKKIIQSQCNDIPPEAFSFFAGYEQENKTMWQQFLDQFNMQITTDEQLQIAIAAANDCFEQFEKNIVGFYAGVAATD